MCYDEKNYELDSFNGVKVRISGILGDESWRVADVYIEDGAGVERLVKLVESERSEWDGFNYSIETVTSIDDVIYDELQERRKHALIRVFLDEFEYKTLDEAGRDAKLEGIAEITGGSSHIHSQYARLLYQIDESLVSESTREFAKGYPPIIDENWAAHLRKRVEKTTEE